MRKEECTYDCHICGAKGLTAEQLNNPEEYGWAMKIYPEDQYGYFVFEMYCPDCIEEAMLE